MKKFLFLLAIPVLLLAYFSPHFAGAVVLIGSVGFAVFYYLRHR
jgi:hypothetical protein